jgi:hypothetical protein
MLARKDVSRTEEKASGGLNESADARGDEEGEGDVPFVSGLSGACEPVCVGSEVRVLTLQGETCVADESMRTRLIGDIVQLLRDTSTPETARVAGLTFVGWLARRRLEEVPHAAGVDEARESERRIRAGRAKAR